MKKWGKLFAVTMCVLMAFGLLMPSNETIAKAAEQTVSEQYVQAMGTGVNIGNSFDSFDRVDNIEIDDETAWGNPVVTKEYIDELKEMGFQSVRIPFTTFTRTDENFQINETFFQRYEDVVNYALDAGLYVMINLHHDSSEWLRYWDGDTSSEEYERFIALWTQLADRFKDYGDHLMFESANEMYFECSTSDEQQNELVGTINQAFYDVVRASGGKNGTRMLVLPTSYTNHGLVYSQYLVDFIEALQDENVMATVHYYSTSLYAFTCNIGVSEFDEELNGMTARDAVDEFYDCLEQTFVANGIGVVVGEYGLFNMGTPGALEDGEMVKFIEYMNYRARELGMCTMLWDSGIIINRDTGEFYNSTYGDVVETSMTDRSSYATGLDELFVTNSSVNDDIAIPLTLNGNTLTAIYNGETQLVEGTDYTYENDTVTLSGSYVSGLIEGAYGVKADLRFVFSAGSDWHEFINYTGTATLEDVDMDIREDDGFMARYDTDGTPTYPTALLSVDFNGKLIRRVASYDESGQPASANTWASDYMQCGSEFVADYDANLLGLMNWYTNAIEDGTYTLVIDFYDGTSVSYQMTKENDRITGTQLTDTNVEYVFSVIDEWKVGCKGSLTITNTTGTAFADGWTVSFDYDRVITEVFGAEFVSFEDGHCVVQNPSWDTAFDAGESITIEFLAGAGNEEAVLSNCILQ